MILDFSKNKNDFYPNLSEKKIEDFDIESVDNSCIYKLDIDQCYNTLRNYDGKVREVTVFINNGQLKEFAKETRACYKNILYTYVTKLVVDGNVYNLNEFRFDLAQLDYFNDFIPDEIKPLFKTWKEYKPTGSYHLVIGCKGAGCHTFAEKLKKGLDNSVVILFNSSNISQYSYYENKHNKCGNLIKECINYIEQGFNVIAIAWIENSKYGWAFAPARDTGVSMDMYFLMDSLNLELCQRRRWEAMLKGKELYLNEKWLNEISKEQQEKLFRIRNKYINKVHFNNIEEWIAHMKSHEIMRLERFKELLENKSNQLPLNIEINTHRIV